MSKDGKSKQFIACATGPGGFSLHKERDLAQATDDSKRTEEKREELDPTTVGPKIHTVGIRQIDSIDDFEPSNGYIQPPKRPWTQSTLIGLRAFWKWVCTPVGFFITLYGLNVVAWGGMLFLLLCGAAPAMCSQDTPANHFDGCNDIESPRRKWIEIDSQILNALFCVTGFGLIPFRFRDLYWLLKYRLSSEKKSGRDGKLVGLRRLAGIHRSWFRLPGSDTVEEVTMLRYVESLQNRPSKDGTAAGVRQLVSWHSTLAGSEDDIRLPLPVSKKPNPPLTGVRAPPTAVWKMDFVVWCNVWNTFFQACLCGFMWGMNRYNRPSWSTGFFIAIACIVAGVGGVMMFKEGKKVKRAEGAPFTGSGLVLDVEKGVKPPGNVQDEKSASSVGYDDPRRQLPT
ncbi:hypothetical protein MBLNU459_g3583t1 [Dothideomycetes sp. NU459]